MLNLLLISLVACSNGRSVSTPTNNTVPLVVDAGYNGQATNRAFISIQICQPGTNNCQTLDYVVVDTGSVGLNIDGSQLNLALPSVDYSNNPIYRCAQYGSGYNFGPMQTADIRIAGEVAANFPITIFQNSGPASCSNGSPVVTLNDVVGGAKAIMGLGVINPSNSLMYPGLYSCINNNCNPLGTNINITTPLVRNVVSTFATDNNGVIFNLPAVRAATNTPITGTLTFGINTQADNMAPQSAHTVKANPVLFANNVPLVGYFSANNGASTTPAIFDSGTPSVQFYSPNITQCTGAFTGIYCPNPSPTNWTSTISSYNGSENFPITMSIVDYSSLATIPAILPGLGQVQTANSFTSYGLTFFYGKTIYARFANNPANIIDPSLPLATGPAWGFKDN